MSDDPTESTNGSSNSPGEFDESAAIDAICHTDRANIVADVVGHPEGMISLPELDYMNPRIEREQIEEHLQALIESGLIGSAELPMDARSSDLPYRFYFVTDPAWELFESQNIMAEEIYRSLYESVEKSPEIQSIQEMERPRR